MALVDVALHRLDPVGLLHPSGAWTRSLARQAYPAIRDPGGGGDESAGPRYARTMPLFGTRIGSGPDFRLEVAFGRLVGHVHSPASHIELPSVINAAEARFSSGPKNSEAPRCGQLFCMSPTWPVVSRKAIRSSPSKRTRSGLPVGRDLPPQQEGGPVQPQQVARRRAPADAAQQVVVGTTQHRTGSWWRSGTSRCSRADSRIARHTSMVAFAQRPSWTAGRSPLTAHIASSTAPRPGSPAAAPLRSPGVPRWSRSPHPLEPGAGPRSRK